MSIKQEIIDFMAARPDETTFLRSEFTEALPACSRAGIDRAIKQMVDDGNLVRLGYGIVARSERKINSITGKPSVFLEKPFRSCVKEALDKLGVPNRLDSASRAYNERRTTQVPAWTAFDIGTARFSRKISLGGVIVYFERAKKVREKKWSGKLKERRPVQRPNLDIPMDADVGEFIIQLANDYWVTYRMDDDEKKEIKNMLVALRRKRIIDKATFVDLLARYQDEIGV